MKRWAWCVLWFSGLTGCAQVITGEGDAGTTGDAAAADADGATGDTAASSADGATACPDAACAANEVCATIVDRCSISGPDAAPGSGSITAHNECRPGPCPSSGTYAPGIAGCIDANGHRTEYPVCF